MTLASSFTESLFGGFLLNSMNGEDSLRKRTRSMNFQPLSCNELREMVPENKEVADGGTEPVLVLDCRSFLAYNECHISSAVNAYCPSILRRRTRGKLPFHYLIPSKEIRDKLMLGVYTTVILYEECPPTSTSHHSIASTFSNAPVGGSKEGASSEDLSSLAVVGRCLQQEGIVRNLYFLEGGFLKFRKRYPQCCVASQEQEHKNDENDKNAASASINVDPQVDNHHFSQPRYEQGDPVEILPHLYLGSAFHAADQDTLSRLRITALLNVSKTNFPHGQLHYMCIPVDDSINVEISSWFHKAITYIDEVRSSGGKVLIHCLAGISRSATICLAYLMTKKRFRLDEAYDYVKKRRSVIAPNLHFMGQLLKYGVQLGLHPPTSSFFGTSVGAVCNNSAANSQNGGASSSPTTSPLHNFVAAVTAATSNSKENCLRNAQRFAYDLTNKDDSFAVSSPTPMLSPMCTTPTPILSPS